MKVHPAMLMKTQEGEKSGIRIHARCRLGVDPSSPVDTSASIQASGAKNALCSLIADTLPEGTFGNIPGWTSGCTGWCFMSHSTKCSRRKFMRITAVATAAGSMAGCVGALSPWRSLNAEEARTLEAVCERIIPTDQDPGAAWAGAVDYIDRQLAGPYRRLRKTYVLGLAGTIEISRARFGKSFVELSPLQQDAVLQAMDSGQAPGDPWASVPAKTFFDLVVSHTQQGFYGDPRHGGNRERVSWRMLKLPYPPVRGRQNSSG